MHKDQWSAPTEHLIMYYFIFKNNCAHRRILSLV